MKRVVRMKKHTGFPHARLLACLLLACLLGVPAPVRGETAFTRDPDAIEKAADSVFMLEVYSAANQQIAVGSGFVAFSPSLLVTNYHVIEGGAYVVAVSDEKEPHLVSRVCCADRNRDIAILAFDKPSGAQPLPLDTDGGLKRSQPVVAIGSPAGLMNTISLGNISAFYTKEGRNWIQFTAPISSGSSGGALFNDEGEIIGVTTATYASAQNINMAVRIEEVIDLYNRWDKRTASAMGNVRGTAAPKLPAAREEAKGSTVWITAGGKKYHNNPDCSKMRNPIETDLMDAIQKGYEPCGKCYK